jgi:hypothetical protein
MRGSAAFRVAVAPGGALAGPWVQNSLWTAARAVPSLDLRFAENKSLTDAKTGASLVTFTRASSGTFVGSDGLVKTAVTNLSLRSQELGDAAWTKTLSSITADATIAPNGTTTADKLVEDSSTGTHNIVEAATITYTSGLAYTFSFFIKKAERQTVQIVIHPNPFPGTVTQRTAIFNSNTGAFVSVGSAYTGSSVTAFSDGWYRISVSSTSDATATGNFTITLCSDDIGTSSYTGNGTSGLFLWGAQLEQASTVGEYIPTTSTINSAPRFDHNPTTGESLGLLVEEARTNLITTSEALANITGASITNNTTTAPDGLVTADTLIEDTSTGSHSVNTASIIWAGNTAYTFTFFLKANTRTQATIAFGTSSNWVNGQRNATFDLSAGTVIATAGSSVTASIEPFLNSWYRCRLTATTVAVPVPSTVQTQMYVSGSTSYTGNGTSGLFFWGAQLEAGAFATSYIPTTTATVTRAADVASITGSNFSSWYRQDEGTIFVEGATAASTASPILFQADDGTANERIQVRRNGTTNASSLLVTDGGTTQANFSVTGYNANTIGKTCAVYSLNDFQLSFNGTLGTADTSGTLPTVDRAFIGSASSPVYANGPIKRLAYWPTRLANSTLQPITQ